jgi:hypothetical protein
LKEVLVELTVGLSALRISVFVAEITEGSILGMDVLRANDASVDLVRHMLRLGQEMLLWSPGARPLSSRRILASNEVIVATCERV